MMKDDTDMDTTVTKEDFEDVVSIFKKKNKKSFYFLTKSGDKFQDSVHILCKRMIKEESFRQDLGSTIL